MKEHEFFTEAIEENLRRLKPKKAPDALIDRLARDADRAFADVRDAKRVGTGSQPSPQTASANQSLWSHIVTLFSPIRAFSVALVVFGVWILAGSIQLRKPVGTGEATESSTEGVPAVPPPGRQFLPFKVENRLVNAEDDGIIGTFANVPFRRVRYQLIDSYTWENLTDGSSIRMAVPREEILILPVSIY